MHFTGLKKNNTKHSMGHIVSRLYKFLKSTCPPCIEYDFHSDILITDISSNVFLHDISMNIPEVVEVVIPEVVEVVEVVEQVEQEVVQVVVKVLTIANPFTPKSLDEILRQKYHISQKKAICLMEEFHTLHAILNLSVEQLSECKCNGRKLGSMGQTIWKQLHPES